MTFAEAARSLVSIVRVPRVGRWVAVIGPAWIVMLADVDAPSVITAARAGTDHGYALLFTLAAVIPVLYLVQEMTARIAIATGRGHAQLIRERYGARWAAFAVVGMVGIDFVAYAAEFAGIALGAGMLGIPGWVAIGGAVALHSIVVLTGSYRRFERIALVLSLALFAFVIVAVGERPDPAAVLGGLAPLPAHPSTGFAGVAVALVGASVMPWMLFYQQAATVDKGLGPDDLTIARRETLVGAVASQGLMAAIVVAAAAAVAAAAVAGPVAGPVAVPAPTNVPALPVGLSLLQHGAPGLLIAVGLIGAGLLATIVISLSAAWALSELLGWPHSLNLAPRRAAGFYGFYLVEVIPAALVALLARDLGSVILDIMVFNVVILVIPLAFLVRLSSDRGLLGALANSRRRQAVLWALTALMVALGLVGIATVAPDIAAGLVPPVR